MAFTLGVKTLQRDAGGLFSFVDSVCKPCYEEGKSAQYLEPSKDFFSYIRDLGDCTKAYLNRFAAGAPSDIRLYYYYRQKLETIRSVWFELHRFVKSAVDADTLSIPCTLLEALTKRLNLLPDFRKTRFAILQFDELSYLQVRVSELKQTADKLKSVIPDVSPFQEDLGLIGIPYSQSSSIYLNSLISHEIGHFVFQKSELKKKLLPEIEKNLEKILGAALKTLPSDDLDWSKDRLESWAEETFCDLFAVWLIGPCYTLTYVELFGLTTILDPNEASGFNVTDGSKTFIRSHPADLFRLKQHVQLLQRLGWWTEIEPLKSHFVDVLKSAITVTDNKFEFPTREKDSGHAHKTLRAFLGLAPFVAGLIMDLTKDAEGKEIDCGLAEYKRFGGLIEEYLRRTVVPSTVFDGKEHVYPSPVALLNASMKFYLESLEDLMSGIEGQNTTLAGHRSRWIQRLESLTGKAIEDHQLLIDEEGALQVGGAFKRADLRPAESADHR